MANFSFLIFSFNGPVCDISFAHINSPLLGAIDETGSMFIYRVEQNTKQSAIHYTSLLSIQRLNTIKTQHHRLVWSPHIHLSKEGVEGRVGKLLMGCFFSKIV